MPALITPATVRPTSVFPVASSQPTNYSPIPQRLITDLHDNVLAIGLYALIGRLYFIHQEPIPLSAPDIGRYDPALSRGAIMRAFNRLVDGGWLIATVRRGHKACYAPTWGRVKGVLLPWRIG